VADVTVGGAGLPAASKTRSGRSEAAIRRRQYISVDGSKPIWVSAVTFHLMSNFSASAVWLRTGHAAP